MPNRINIDGYAIIIGAMKCGTTSLYSYLQEHPEICPAITKEPEFFSENQGRGAQVSNYNDLWDFDDSVHIYALEASTGYTKYPLEPNVPQNMYRYGIMPKFIYIIRNPFDRITSHFNFMRKSSSWDLNIDDNHLINTSKYFLQLEQYRQYFPRENILVLDFDELRENPRQVLQNIFQFLGLSYSCFPEKFEIKNATQIEPETKLEKKIRKLKLSTISGYIPIHLKERAKNLIRGVFPPEKKLNLSDTEIQFVYDELKEDMAKLQQAYGFDVCKWGF